MIESFRNEYFFLSNFYPCSINYKGVTYQNAEAAFQSMKTCDLLQRASFSFYTPSQAKIEGRNCELRKDWELVKDEIMYDVVFNKFLQNADLRKKLLDTYPEELIEGNNWHDNYWGDCKCVACLNNKGDNKLGIILMDVRDFFFKQKENINYEKTLEIGNQVKDFLKSQYPNETVSLTVTKKDILFEYLPPEVEKVKIRKARNE